LRQVAAHALPLQGISELEAQLHAGFFPIRQFEKFTGIDDFPASRFKAFALNH
jgi:hypothetical protein